MVRPSGSIYTKTNQMSRNLLKKPEPVKRARDSEHYDKVIELLKNWFTLIHMFVNSVCFIKLSSIGLKHCCSCLQWKKYCIIITIIVQ